MPAVRFLFFLALIVFPTVIFAQNAEATAEEKARRQTEFLEQIIGDAKNLRLPENRAFVYVKAGSALWQSDEKRARQLFESSLGELTAAQNEVETERNGKQAFSNLIYGQSPRWEILYAIANYDAEFALDAMVKTRPPKLVQALAGQKNNYQSQSRQIAFSETQNEQRLITIAAQKNPKRAAELLRESLKKGVSYETFSLIKKIFETDEKTANELAAEVGQKLLDMPLDEDESDSSLQQAFLAEFAETPAPETKSVKISDALLRSLSQKIVKLLLGENSSFYINDTALKIIEKFLPSAAGQIKQKQEKLQKLNMNEQEKTYYSLMQEDVPAEELLSQVEKLPRYQRGEIYQRAAEKTAKSGNMQQARQILSNNMADEDSDRSLSELNYNLANQAISESKFSEAASLINQITEENMRFTALLYLATSIYQKNPKENQSQAAAILEQARAVIPDAPDKLSDINSIISVASGYTDIDEARAFRLIESVVPSLNEYSEAVAVISKFGENGNFRQGEYQITSGGNASGAYNLPYILQKLKISDFQRAVQITKMFNRLDVRLSLQLQLIDAVSNSQLTVLKRRFGDSMSVRKTK